MLGLFIFQKCPLQQGFFFGVFEKNSSKIKLKLKEFFKKLKDFPENSRMTSLLLSNNDVIVQIFTKKLKENPRKRAKNSRRSSKTHCPAKLLFPIGRKIAEKTPPELEGATRTIELRNELQLICLFLNPLI